jgi:hypothetical protein
MMSLFVVDPAERLVVTQHREKAMAARSNSA